MFTFKKQVLFTSLLLGMFAAVIVTTPAEAGKSKTATRIDMEAKAALKKLYKANPAAKRIGAKATAILVFPTIVKAGFMYGAATGYGALLQKGKTIGYYDTFSASYGFQAGVQAFGYALFFMDKNSLSYLDKSGGFELGVGPSLVVLDQGMAKKMSSTTVQKGVYAIIFDQAGAMAGAGIEGTKISRFHP
jgi:lipid-binding SYLF domain-containing protein